MTANRRRYLTPHADVHAYIQRDQRAPLATVRVTLELDMPADHPAVAAYRRACHSSADRGQSAAYSAAEALLIAAATHAQDARST